MQSVIRLSGGRCPICAEALEARVTRTCAACDTRHHTDCWGWAGGCAVYACAGGALPATSPPPEPIVSRPPAEPEFLRRHPVVLLMLLPFVLIIDPPTALWLLCEMIAHLAGVSREV